MIVLHDNLHNCVKINKNLFKVSVIKDNNIYNNCKLFISDIGNMIYFYDEILNNEIEEFLKNGYLFCLPYDMTEKEIKHLIKIENENKLFMNVKNLHTEYLKVIHNDNDDNDEIIIPEKLKLICAIEKVLEMIDEVFGAYYLKDRGCYLKWIDNFTHHIKTPKIKPREKEDDGPVPVPRPR